MAASFKVGTFAPSGSTGSQAVTGVGFQPKLMVFWCNGHTGSPASASHNRMMLGAATSSTSEFLIACSSDDAVGTSLCEQSIRATGCIGSWNEATSGWAFLADFTSMDADGFTINWSTAGDAGHDVHYLAIGGADVSVAIKQFTSKATTGSQATTGVGFQPEAIIIAGAIVATSNSLPVDGIANHAPRIGMATGATEECAMAWYSENANATSECDRRYSESATVTSIRDGSVDFGEADLTSFDSDGFTLNWSTADTTTRYLWAICLRGCDLKVGNETQQTSATTKATTGVGFQPDALFFLSTGQTAAGSATNSKASIGASDTASDTSAGWWDNDGQATTSNSRRSETTRSIAYVGDGESESEGEASVSAVGSDGFTLNWAVADGTARKFCYLAMAETAAASGINNLTLLGVG